MEPVIDITAKKKKKENYKRCQKKSHYLHGTVIRIMPNLSLKL
jgi:hypothetical protein